MVDDCRLQALIVCTHLRPGRNKRRSKYLMQPLSGLQIASLIDQSRFNIRLHHEDWHGPFDVTDCRGFQLVFLTGLQPDFDRMRQLAFFFRRQGAVVVAGGSICTLFPEFATRFFDVVCVGGVECVPEIVTDFLREQLKPIYTSPTRGVEECQVDYSHFANSGISPTCHLLEATRGCSFRCSFCTIPAEGRIHAPYSLKSVVKAIDSAVSTSPYFSFRRWYPIILFLDNNFADDVKFMLALCQMLGSNKKVRGWGALVTQNIIRDRALIDTLAASKCNGLFVGLELLDRELLRRNNKTQNLGRGDVIEDIAYAEARGIGITYGYLFDPRHQTAKEMERQIVAIAQHPLMPMPTYMSVIAPLAGTQTFWDDLKSGHLATNLRLRDLDGETIAYSQLADDPTAIASFIERLFRRPWLVVGRAHILIKTLRRIARSGTLNPVRWFFLASANLHCFVWSRAEVCAPRTYFAGSETLDPQYDERPPDLSEKDRERYFTPITLTDEFGAPANWLKPYFNKRFPAQNRNVETERHHDLPA